MATAMVATTTLNAALMQATAAPVTAYLQATIAHPLVVTATPAQTQTLLTLLKADSVLTLENLIQKNVQHP
jgi:hypothetical protein